jgi:hypothetical protein
MAEFESEVTAAKVRLISARDRRDYMLTAHLGTLHLSKNSVLSATFEHDGFNRESFHHSPR